MNDARARALARAADQGDEEARIALGAQRVREGRCPWCGEDRGDGAGCCMPCWHRLVPCPDCPDPRCAKAFAGDEDNDGQSKEDSAQRALQAAAEVLGETRVRELVCAEVVRRVLG